MPLMRPPEGKILVFDTEHQKIIVLKMIKINFRVLEVT